MKLYLINTYHREKEKKIKGYVSFLEELGVSPQVLDEDELYRVDGPVIISGSHKMVGNGEVSDRLREFIEECRYPLLGICYGHQAMIRVLGGEVQRCKKYHKGREKIFRLKHHPLLETLGAEFFVEESHYECVQKVPDEFEVLAISKDEEDGEIIEVVSHRKSYLYGTQFHPERSGENGKILMQNFLKLAGFS